jgi:FtsZ-binding cell division protein ZapB
MIPNIIGDALMGNEIKQEDQIKLPQDFQALIAGFFPNTKYFDSRFDLLQVQIDELRRNQGQIKDQLKDFKDDTDKHFGQVDYRFQRLEDKIDNLIERIDVKVDGGLKENRNLTVRLFTFALSFSLVAVIGMFGKLFGLF